MPGTLFRVAWRAAVADRLITTKRPGRKRPDPGCEVDLTVAALGLALFTVALDVPIHSAALLALAATALLFLLALAAALLMLVLLALAVAVILILVCHDWILSSVGYVARCALSRVP